MPARWGKLTAAEILDAVTGTWVSGSLTTVFTGISTDSRHIQSGEMFWALKGPRYDGHDFVLTALERGAPGVVVDRAWWASTGCTCLGSTPGERTVIAVDDTLEALGDFAWWWRHQHAAKVVAITGSSGKTTTKEMAAAICAQRHHTLKNEGNFNNLIGLPLTLLRLRDDHEIAVLEMGMNRPGEIGRLTRIAGPDTGVILNIGMAHLEGVLDIEGVARAKCEMVENMEASGLMILNGDDDRLMTHAGPYPVRKMTFGMGPENQVRAEDVRDLGLKGIQFTLAYGHGSWPARIRIPGLYNLYNALAAAAIGFNLGEAAETILHGLESYPGMNGRFRVYSLWGGITVIDDTYNANPSSLKAVLGSVKSLAQGQGCRLIVGLGEMRELGDAAVSSHQEAGGQVAAAGADRFFALGPHGREMIQGAIQGGMPRNKVKRVAGHDEMVDEISHAVTGGGLVLLKGSRKMALEKVVNGLERIFGPGKMD